MTPYSSVSSTIRLGGKDSVSGVEREQRIANMLDSLDSENISVC